MSTLVDLVHCADDAYDPSYCLSQGMSEIGERIIPIFDNQNGAPRGFIRTSPKKLVVAFKGTTTPADFITDALAILETAAKGRAHAGFLIEFAKVWTQVRNSITHNPKMTLCITGHSLGGALAELAAMQVKLELGIDPEVATFGCPYVWDAEGAAAYNALVPKNTRVVHNLDLVPRIPGPELGYEQTHGLLHLTDEGHEIGPVRTWLGKLFYDVEIVKSDLEGVSLENHDRALYVAAVERWDERYNDARP